MYRGLAMPNKCCKHGIGEIYLNSIGERCLFCEIWDEQRNIDLGDCLGNCESEEPESEVRNGQT